MRLQKPVAITGTVDALGNIQDIFHLTASNNIVSKRQKSHKTAAAKADQAKAIFHLSDS
jgi:hypothetical protein